MVSGDNSDRSADTDGYIMTGTGDESRLTLSGRFPVRNHNDDVASNVDSTNNVTFRLTEIAGFDLASGTIDGSFRDNVNNPCTVEDGTVEFSR